MPWLEFPHPVKHARLFRNNYLGEKLALPALRPVLRRGPVAGRAFLPAGEGRSCHSAKCGAKPTPRLALSEPEHNVHPKAVGGYGGPRGVELDLTLRRLDYTGKPRIPAGFLSQAHFHHILQFGVILGFAGRPSVPECGATGLLHNQSLESELARSTPGKTSVDPNRDVTKYSGIDTEA